MKWFTSAWLMAIPSIVAGNEAHTKGSVDGYADNGGAFASYVIGPNAMRKLKKGKAPSKEKKGKRKTLQPSSPPSSNPSLFPSTMPSSNPTSAPSTMPSSNPTSAPSTMPSSNPTSASSTMPSFVKKEEKTNETVPLISFGNDAQNAPLLDYSLPDMTPYSGRYLVSLPNVVKDNWWITRLTASRNATDSIGANSTDTNETPKPWAWKPIGDFYGSVSSNSTVYEVQALPTSNPSDYITLEPITFGEKRIVSEGYSIRMKSGTDVSTTHNIYMTIVGRYGRTTNELQFPNDDLVANGYSASLHVLNETDVGGIERVIVKKKGKKLAVILAENESGEGSVALGIKNYRCFKSYELIQNDKYAWYSVPNGVELFVYEDCTYEDTSDFVRGPAEGFLVTKPSSAKVTQTKEFDWELLSIEINGVEYAVPEDDQKFPIEKIHLAEGRREIDNKSGNDTILPPLLSALFLREDERVDLKKAFTHTKSDAATFYSRSSDSDNFELELEGYEIVPGSNNEDEVLPTFGLMARGSVDPMSQYFGLLFVGSIEDQYSIQTVVRASSEDVVKVVGSQNVALSDIRASKLRITRTGIMFKGYYNNVLIGEANLKVSSVNQEDETKGVNGFNQTSQIVRPNVQLNPKVEIGIACFSPQKYELGNYRIALPSSMIRFNKVPTFIKQETAAAADLINKKSFSIIEIINLSSFYGSYGAGKTIKTFSLLPDEMSEISVRSYKESTTTSQKTSTIFDSFNDESAQDFERSIEEEQSNARQYEKSREVHAEVRASYSGYGASVSASVGASASESSARQEMARSVMTAVSKHAAKASSQRDVEVNTSSEVQETVGTENSVKRTIRNINSSRTLNFVFRQMNQQYISALHLVDLRVAFVGGGEGTYAEEDISNLETFVRAYVKEEYAEKVINRLHRKLQFVVDHEDNMREVLTKKTVDRTNLSLVKEGGAAPPSKHNSTTDNSRRTPLSFPVDEEEEKEDKILSYYAFDKDVTSTLSSRKDVKLDIEVPGVILAYGSNVLRTDGIIVDALLGEGDALDKYGNELQGVDIDEKKSEVELTNAKTDLLLLQKDILTKKTDSDGVSKEQQLEGLSNLNLLEPKYLAHNGFGPENN